MVVGRDGRGLARWLLRGRAACSYAATGAGGTQALAEPVAGVPLISIIRLI